jgi:hypothetical protein
MLKDDQPFTEIFHHEAVQAMNAVNKQPIFTSFTWTLNIHSLNKTRVPKEARDVLIQFRTERDRANKLKTSLPPIGGDARRRDYSDNAGSRTDFKPRVQLGAEASLKKGPTQWKSSEVLGDLLGTEDHVVKFKRNSRKQTKVKEPPVDHDTKLRAELESIDSLVKCPGSEAAVKSYISELVKGAKATRLLNPEKYLKDSQRLFDTTTILSKGTQRKSMELQARISASYARLNPSKARHLSLLSEDTTASGHTRTKHKTKVSESNSQVMLTKLRGLVRSQSQMSEPRGEGVPFSLLHTLRQKR